MEDAHCIHLGLQSPAVAMFGIFDGHSGSACSRYVAENLPKNIAKMTDISDTQAMRQVVLETDEQFLTAGEYRMKDDGSAAIFTVDIYDEATKTHKLINGNVGDSRTVLAKKIDDGKYKAITLTHDHKPTDELERKRIEAAGGTVQLSRVDGQLALSRAFGDRMLKMPMSPDWPREKRKVTSDPEFIIETACSEDFLFMACDGIFEGDVFTRETAIAWIVDKMKETDDLAVVCAQLLEECLIRGSRDNMSAMIIQFKDGTDYHKEEHEYVPGPWFNGENDHKFQEAYIADAKVAGYTLQEALQMFKDRKAKEEASSPKVDAGESMTDSDD